MKNYIFNESKEFKKHKERDSYLSSKGFKHLWNYFLEIINQKPLIDYIKTLRIKYGIPQNGFKLGDKRLLNIDSVHLYDDIIALSVKYGLNGILWAETMSLLIKYNIVQEPTGVGLCQLSDFTEGTNENKISQYIRIYAHPISIKVSPYASKRSILDWIEKNFGAVQKLQAQYKNPEIKIGQYRTKNTRIQQRNKFIWDNRNLSRQIILGKIKTKFGSSLNLGYQDIAKIISLEKKRRK